MILKRQGRGWGVAWFFWAAASFSSGDCLAQLQPRDFAVELTADVRKEPPEIVLNWRGDQYARSYTINRKDRTSNEWRKIGSAAGHETWFADREVTLGTGYEYQVVKEGTLQYTGYGYIYAGIEVPLVENRGRLILLVESSVAEALEMELRRLESDLVGDGWIVARRDVPREASVTEVKDIIRATYATAPAETRALFLFGNVPVPYSGDLTPDEHENHQGAWPADVYYGDLDGGWTDETVRSIGAATPWNHNLPGDGKFDQSEVPSTMELQVGRVDLSRMTCFSNKTPPRSEIDLLRLYLEKDHAFRHGRLPTEARALVFDRNGLTQPEPLSAMAWRNFTPFVGSNIDVIGWGEYLPTVSSKSYLWTAVLAGGGFSHSDGVASSDGFALYNVNAVFTMFSGSYFGDWDNESNFLRAALGANGRLLVSVYSAQPQWICHTMALGETIGTAAKMTQENGASGIYVPHNRGAGQVHVSLHGDPSLRAHPVPSPGRVRATAQEGGVLLSWDPSASTEIAGYYVYEADEAAGPYRRITSSPVSGTSFSVTGGTVNGRYMVKALTLTRSPSGSYWNTSQGMFYPDAAGTTPNGAPAAPRTLVVTELREGTVALRWLSGSADSWGFDVERRDPGASSFVKIASVAREKFDFVDTTASALGSYAYRVRAFNSAGPSAYSNTVIANTQPGTAEFLGEDRMTQGAWIGRYGSAGYYIPGIADEVPPGLSVTSSNVFTFTTHLYDDVRALAVPGATGGSVNTWNHIYPFAMHVNFEDEAVHQFAFYVMSYSQTTSQIDVEVYDAVTRNLLDRRTVQNLNGGIYLVYHLTRQVIIRIIPPGVYRQGEVYGFFVDDPKVHPVHIEPGGGTFTGKVLVRMSTLTPQAEIRYTLDGTEPRMDSPLYTEPFWLYADATVRAVAFRAGFPPAEITSAQFQNTVENSFALVGWNEETAGNWAGKLGADGYWIAGGQAQLPAYAEVTGLNGTPWLWNDNPDELRALYRDNSQSGRVAAASYGDEVNLDLAIFDTRRRAVALYFVDWDRQQRVQQVEVIDGAGNVRESYTVSDFANGRYLTFAVKGYLRVRIKAVEGPNAVLSGLFFDLAPRQVEVGTPVPFSNAHVSSGAIVFTVTGFPDERFCLDRSENLREWTCYSTNLIVGEQFEMRVPLAREERARFLRGHIVP